jgi:hypothetical protein
MRVLSCLLLVAGALPSGCSSQMQPDGPGLGSLRMDLAATVEGVDYRLRAAVFSLQGPVHVSLASELDSDATALVAAVPGGDYVVSLADGWLLEREDVEGPVAVAATLLSPNPSEPIQVTPGATAAVPLQLSTDGASFTLGGLAPLLGIP